MNFTHYDLGYQEQGKVVEIGLEGTECNVQLMDSLNFSNYRSGRSYNYLGGHVTQSLVQLEIPHSGTWHVAIDLGGYQGEVRSLVNVL